MNKLNNLLLKIIIFLTILLIAFIISCVIIVNKNLNATKELYPIVECVNNSGFMVQPYLLPNMF